MRLRPRSAYLPVDRHAGGDVRGRQRRHLVRAGGDVIRERATGIGREAGAQQVIEFGDHQRGEHQRAGRSGEHGGGAGVVRIRRVGGGQ